MSSTKEIYWVCRQPSAEVWQKINLLQKYHISVRVLPDFPALVRSYGETRLNTIVIGDELADAAFETFMQKLSNHPEYSGVRFVLSISKPAPALVQKAVDLGFRDIIPIDLPESAWLRRYAFASSGRPTELHDSHPKMSMHGIGSVQVPGRIAWITSQELWLETRIQAQVGSELSLMGGLAELMGVKQIRLKVLNSYRSHLHFRYSEALLCRWDVTVANQARKAAVQEFIKDQGSRGQYRFYAIIRNREIRNALVKKLPMDRFQITVALNKNNMIQEPRFIAPDAVIVEDKMCVGAHKTNFDEMLKHLDPSIPVFVIGEAASQVKAATKHTLVPVTTVPDDYPAMFERVLGAPKRVNNDATPIPKDHALSFAQIAMPTRILNLHPDCVEVATAFPLGRFGLFSLEAPLFQQSLQQKVHGKVIDSWDAGLQNNLKDFPYHSKAIIVDLPKEQRDKLATQMVELFSQQMVPKAADAVVEAPREETFEPVMIDNSPGPMKTEVARPIRESSPSPAPSSPAPSEPTFDVIPGPVATGIETEVLPLAEQIGIDRNYRDGKVAGFFESLWEMIGNIPSEIKIFGFVVVAIALMVVAGFYLRAPEEKQDTIFTDSLKAFQKDHGGPRRDRASQGEGEGSPDPDIGNEP